MSIKYKGGFKYQLEEDYSIKLKKKNPFAIHLDFIRLFANGKLVIKKGYCWDGPSGPTVDTLNFMRGSLVHDALYELIRKDHLQEDEWREFADDLLREICKEDGMSSLRAWYVWKSVRAFGCCAVQNPKEVMVAPYKKEPAWSEG
jgi:hypothetical protein